MTPFCNRAIEKHQQKHAARFQSADLLYMGDNS
jgi:hypothetical protein